MFGGYYFFIASKTGADRQVMGIAFADEPLQGWSGFLSAPNDLYPWCPVDQVRCGWIRSAVHLHLYALRSFYCTNFLLPLRAIVQGRVFDQES